MNWNDLIEQQYRREEWLQAAEQRRLVAATRSARPQQARFYHPIFVGLGRRLVAWGWSLQARGGGLIETSAALVVIEGPRR
jgi:hypothetical protein